MCMCVYSVAYVCVQCMCVHSVAHTQCSVRVCTVYVRVQCGAHITNILSACERKSCPHITHILQLF